MSSQRAGREYPRSVGEFQSWFRSDADCLDYLEWLRWPDGFVCERCGHASGGRLGDGRIECTECEARTSAAGIIFDKTRTPLTVWFTACWLSHEFIIVPGSFGTRVPGCSAAPCRTGGNLNPETLHRANRRASARSGLRRP